MPDEQKVERDLPYRASRGSSFLRSERLLTTSDYSTVFDAPTARFSAKSLSLLYKKNDWGFSRVGIIMPKKFVKLATRRNRFKRLIREQFRLGKDCLPNADIVFLLKRETSEHEFMSSCDRVWKFLILENNG